MPDRMWIIKATKYTSIVIAIEAKAQGADLSCLQALTLGKLTDQGAVAAVIEGKDVAHLMRVRNEIIRRLQLASEEPRSSSV